MVSAAKIFVSVLFFFFVLFLLSATALGFIVYAPVGVFFLLVLIVSIVLFARWITSPGTYPSRRQEPRAYEQPQPYWRHEPEPDRKQNERNKMIGNTFEKYLISRIDLGVFEFEHWNTDEWANLDGTRRISGYDPEDQGPDLLFKHRRTGQKVFVEAKFISYENELANIVSPDQINRYRTAANGRGALCFVAIGLGWPPNQPQRLSIIPLSHVSPNLSMETFQYFKREPTKMIAEDSLLWRPPS